MKQRSNQPDPADQKARLRLRILAADPGSVGRLISTAIEGREVTEENKKTIRTVREEILRSGGNLDLLDGLCVDDYVYHGPALLGDLSGLAAFKEMASGFDGSLDGSRETVEDQIAEGDRVMTRITGKGRHTGELMGAPPTGKEIRWTAVIVSRFENGKIAEEWAEFDALDFLQRIGAVPPLG